MSEDPLEHESSKSYMGAMYLFLVENCHCDTQLDRVKVRVGHEAIFKSPFLAGIKSLVHNNKGQLEKNKSCDLVKYTHTFCTW